MTENFTWNELKNDDVIVPSVRAVAVYENQAGEIVIRQERSWSEDEDPVVIVPRAYLGPLIAKLKAMAG
jgi:hypothetical protein